MMMRQGIFIASFVIVTGAASAQYSESIISGRPGQAIASQTPGKGVFQLETGFDRSASSWTESNPLGTSTFDSVSVLNATLLRFGILNKLEIHSGWEFRDDKLSVGDKVDKIASGMSFASFGIRHNLIEGGGKKPSLAYQVSAKLNILADEYNAKRILPHFMFTSGMSLTDNLGITLNSGMDFGDQDAYAWLYIVNFGYSLSDKLFTFAELYGGVDVSADAAGDQFNPYFDGGFGYFVNNDLQLDVLGGYAANNNVEEYFVSVGLSWRLNHPKEMPAQ
jgi:hypothetical protein